MSIEWTIVLNIKHNIEFKLKYITWALNHKYSNKQNRQS